MSGSIGGFKPLQALGTVAKTLGNVWVQSDPFGRSIGLYGKNPQGMSWSNLGRDIRDLNSATPFNNFAAKADPIGNRLEFYGRRADVPTPYDPLGIKMGLYGYNVNQPNAGVDPGTIQYTPEQMADPAILNSQRQAAADTLPSSSSKLLLGQ